MMVRVVDYATQADLGSVNLVALPARGDAFIVRREPTTVTASVMQVMKGVSPFNDCDATIHVKIREEVNA